VRFLLTLLAGSLLWAQVPRIATIDLYGLRRVSRERILKELKLRDGDRLPASKGAVEERLEQLDHVAAARLEAVCCENGAVALFIGIAEKGGPHFAWRSAPGGDVTLPPAIVETHRDLLRAMQEAGRRGSLAQDLTQGHALAADPAGRALQEKIAVFAREHLPLIRQALREAADEEQRAIAVTVAGYAPDKAAILDDLLYALQDPDEIVRANAVRALEAVAVLAQLKPELGLKISPTWFVEMLNSITLSDRYRAATALVTLTDRGGADVLAQIRERAWGSVIEMARWKHLRYAVPAFVLLGRASGLSEKQIEDAWSSPRREANIDAILNPGKKR
jgi:hypothetical protein